MQTHTKIYIEFFGFDTSDFIPCEICKHRAVDIHHIENRGMGGGDVKDFIENLMALCRECHNAFGDITELIDYLKHVHKLHMDNKDQIALQSYTEL